MLANGSFSPGKNVAVVLNQITILEKQVIKKWLERCQKRKGRQGEKGIARSLKHHGTVHGQPYRGGKLFPNRRLSSVNNGLIAGLSTHHNQSENKTRSEGEAGEILGGRLNLHGNVVLKSWNFVSSAWGAQIVSLHFFLYFWQEVGRRNQGRSQKGRCHFVLLHLLLTLSFVWAMGDPAVNPCPSERTRPCRNVQRGDHKALKGTHLCAWKQQWPEDSERCVIRGQCSSPPHSGSVIALCPLCHFSSQLGHCGAAGLLSRQQSSSLVGVKAAQPVPWHCLTVVFLAAW